MEECFGSNYNAGFYRSMDSSRTYHEPINLTANHWVAPSSALPTVSRFPRRDVCRPTKRKQEHRTVESSHGESYLLQLCRGQHWVEVIRRCQYYPEEAGLVPIPRKNFAVHCHPTSQVKSHPILLAELDRTPIFRETALGVLCASKGISTDGAKYAILALINANPSQVGASQSIAGHTALRDAILNESCTVEVFKMILEATMRIPGGDLALRIKDGGGLSPIDHLVASVQLGSSLYCMDIMEEFLGAKPLNVGFTDENDTSPLIRLLTLGNSFNHLPTQTATKAAHKIRSKTKEPDNETLRLNRVLKATKLLLDNDPTLIYHRSRVTNCTPLHVALRNYGNFEPLIRELLERDTLNDAIKARNLYGDLPIHVACSVCVPLQVLGLIVERSARAGTSEKLHEEKERQLFVSNRDPLIWSTNQSGYTPVDLEWIRHIESRPGSYTARSIYPSETSRMRTNCFKEDSYYRELLKESVEMVVVNSKSIKNGNGCDFDGREEEAKEIFGPLMDRISLLIRAAANSTSISGCHETVSTKLVPSCTLSTPYSPTLPLPILELFLWLRPEEVLKKDRLNMLPIHHALRYSKTLRRSSTSSSAVDDWKSFVLQLLNKSPDQCKIKCKHGRLPLHYVLDHIRPGDGSVSKTSSWLSLQASRHAIVEKLIELYPESVDKCDPVTRLYPFMVASMDQNLSVDTVFILLRHSPSRCPVYMPKATM